jgi:hypothetical protein
MFKNHRHYNCEITLDNGENFRVSAHWMHNNNLDNWQGWVCEAGHKRLHIDQYFNVYGATCQNDSLGNLFGDWMVLDAPTVCQKQRCTGCTDDLLTSKYAVSD